MKRKFIVFFIVFLFLILSYSNKKEFIVDNDSKIVLNNSLEEEKENSITVNAIIDDKTVKLDLEEYVKGVVACEMPASFNSEALKAMSVAARTFALYKISKGKSLKTTVSDQCYINNDKMKSKWKNSYDKYYAKISNAVNDTKNEYMTYNDKVIIAFYFSISNGKTENVENVFSQKLDYLVSVDSSWDKKSNNNEKDIKIKVSDFLKKLNLKDDKISNIKIDRSPSNRVNNIKINNNNYKGTKFRSLLGLRSTDFSITYDKDFVYIHTVGYGHGVGMSQYGANYMANDGYSYDEILKHYYTGIKITNKL